MSKIWSPTRPLCRPVRFGPGARTATGWSTGCLLMPVMPTFLASLFSGTARLTCRTVAVLMRETPRSGDPRSGCSRCAGTQGVAGGFADVLRDAPGHADILGGAGRWRILIRQAPRLGDAGQRVAAGGRVVHRAGQDQLAGAGALDQLVEALHHFLG